MSSADKITVKTTRFGVLTVDADRLISMPHGVLGFPESKRFVMLDHDQDSPFRWLQSLDEPELAFVVTDPRIFFPDYHIEVKVEELTGFNVKKPEDVAILVILSLRGGADDMTANLQGPLLINTQNRMGRQVVLKEGEYHTRHRLFSDAGDAGQDQPAAP